jgi:predicted regulator of Ras-like GTPase activity (Roadblock/LC7/MglB family)
MGTLPQLLEEDIQQIDAALRELLKKTDATTALVIDKGGFLISSQGESANFDLISISALASGAFMATQTIAGLVHETNFNSVYQQGEKCSILATSIDDESILVVIFDAQVSVGLVKYFAPAAIERVTRQLQTAHQRDPENSLDLSVLNMADTTTLFRRKA